MAKLCTETFPPLLSERFHKMENTGPCYIEYSICKFGLTLTFLLLFRIPRPNTFSKTWLPGPNPQRGAGAGEAEYPFEQVRVAVQKQPTFLARQEVSRHIWQPLTMNKSTGCGHRNYITVLQYICIYIYRYIKWSPPWVNRHWWPHLYLLGSNHLTLRRLGNRPCSPFTCEDYTTVVCSLFK